MPLGCVGADRMHKTSLFDERWVRRTGKSHVTCMEKDPHTIFTYWEVDDLRKDLIARHFRSDWDVLPLYLCVYDVTDCWFNGTNAPLVARIRVQSCTDNWYVYGLQPNRNYVVDVAAAYSDDRLFAILRSNVVTLPPSKAAPSQPLVKFTPVQPRLISLEVHPYESQFDGYHICE